MTKKIGGHRLSFFGIRDFISHTPLNKSHAITERLLFCLSLKKIALCQYPAIKGILRHYVHCEKYMDTIQGRKLPKYEMLYSLKYGFCIKDVLQNYPLSTRGKK
jgi:hypothetical protein